MKVDVLMPFRNAAHTLPAALDSIAAQTHPDLRLIAVDDGSTDASSILVSRFPRLVLLLPSAAPGLVAALNTGLAVADAPFIARMDADDVMAPDRIARQLAALAEHPDWDAVACRVAYEGGGEGFRHYVEWTNTLLTPDDIAMNRFVESPLIHPSIFFRASLARKKEVYRSGDFPEDYELWLRWLEAGVHIGKLPETLLTWRDSDHRLSRTDPRYRIEAFYRTKSDYLARWLAANNPHHPDVVVWGAGYRTRKRVRLLEERGVRVKAYIDINPRRKGTVINGIPVLIPDDLPAPGQAFILPYVGSRGARDHIVRSLTAKGHIHGHHFICAA